MRLGPYRSSGSIIIPVPIMVNKADNKTFIVSHSAYGYWEEAYGLEQIGISGLSPTDEPSQNKLWRYLTL